MSTRVSMLTNRVLIKLDGAKEKVGSLYIPDTGKDAPQIGTVIAVGPGRYTENGAFIETNCQAGDRVIFSKYAGSTVEIDGDSFIVVRDDEVLLKVQEAEEHSDEQPATD